MHVLVTGSAGRVGQRVVALLRARGDTVTGFDLKPLGGTDGGYREVIGAFDDPAAVARAIQGAEVVLHLGAFMSWLPADAGRVYAANATGTFHLLAAAAAAKVRRFVLASTGEVYPEVRPRYLPLDESHPREPTSVYGLSKLLAEEMTAFFTARRGCRSSSCGFRTPRTHGNSPIRRASSPVRGSSCAARSGSSASSAMRARSRCWSRSTTGRRSSWCSAARTARPTG